MSSKDYRDYQHTTKLVQNHYQKMRTFQTLDYVKRMKKKYTEKLIHPMTLWEVFDKLEYLIDQSDPDLIGIPNIHHAFQTAEKVRIDGHPEWLQLTALLHDLGKIMYLWGCDQDGTSQKEQWGLVGDTFILGCQLPDKLVLSNYNKLNPDMNDPLLQSKLGIYQKECGFDNCYVAWGHDEYLYQVLKQNKCNLPEEALYIIRYHSLYPWHDQNCYEYLANEKDKKMLKWLKLFSQYDLYSKTDEIFDYHQLYDYYSKLIKKYFPEEILLW